MRPEGLRAHARWEPRVRRDLNGRLHRSWCTRVVQLGACSVSVVFVLGLAACSIGHRVTSLGFDRTDVSTVSTVMESVANRNDQSLRDSFGRSLASGELDYLVMVSFGDSTYASTTGMEVSGPVAAGGLVRTYNVTIFPRSALQDRGLGVPSGAATAPRHISLDFCSRGARWYLMDVRPARGDASP